MIRWLLDRFRDYQERKVREQELGLLSERAAHGHVKSATTLIQEFLVSDDPELRKALLFQADKEVRTEVARCWLQTQDARLAQLLQDWNFIPDQPAQLHFAVCMLLDQPVKGEPDLYLPILLRYPQTWHWVEKGLWQDYLFEQFMLNRLPDDLRKRLPGLPRDPALRAAYLLLTDRNQELEELDYDGSLISQAYQMASAGLRARMLAHLRQLGKAELAVQMTAGKSESKGEWETQFELLKKSGKHEQLWQMVGKLPPIWAAQALKHLKEQNFQPQEKACYDELQEALPEDFNLTPQQIFTHAGAPLLWLGERDLLLTGPQLCQVDLKEVQQVTLPIGSHARTWRLSPDAARLAVVESFTRPGSYGDDRQFSLRLLQRATGNPIIFSRPPLKSSTPVSFSPDSQWMVAHEEQMLRLFPTGGGRPRWELPVRGRGKFLFLSDEELLYVGLQTLMIDVQEGRVRWSVSEPLERPHVRLQRDEQLLLFGDGRRMQVIDRQKGTLLGSPTARQSIYDAVFGPGGTVLATGLTRCELLDVATGEVMMSHEWQHSSHVRFAPDGFRLARARGKVLEMVDTFEGSRIGAIGLPGPITQVDFSPDGLLLAVGISDRQTHVFAVPPSTSVRGLSPDALQELERLSATSPAWRFLYALAKFRVRYEMTVEDWEFHANDAYMIEVE